MNNGKRTATTTGALDAFFPAVLALDGDLNRARALQDSMFTMWEVNHIEPEVYNYKTGKVEFRDIRSAPRSSNQPTIFITSRTTQNISRWGRRCGTIS